jgi:hypothetical protein
MRLMDERRQLRTWINTCSIPARGTKTEHIIGLNQYAADCCHSPTLGVGVWVATQLCGATRAAGVELSAQAASLQNPCPVSEGNPKALLRRAALSSFNILVGPIGR